MSPAMVLVAAVLVLVAALATLAVGAEIQRRMDDRRLAVVPDPSTQLVSPLPSPAVTPVAPTSWTLTSLGTVSGLPFQAAAVADSEPGSIAVSVRRCVETAVRDGQSMYDCSAAVARSEGGRAWTPVGTLPRLIGGVVHRGVDIRNDRPIGAIWTSPDGRTWTWIADDTVFDVGGYVDTGEDPGAGGVGAFASDGEAIVAGGQVCADGGLPCAAAAWMSSDGPTWARVEPLPTGLAILDAVALDGTFVATVRRCPATGECSTVVIHSADGLAWEEAPGTAFEDAVMAVSGGTVVLVTGRDRSLEARASADGATWTSLGSVTAHDGVSWGAPALVPRPGGAVDILVRADPVDPAESEADAYTTAWKIVTAP